MAKRDIVLTKIHEAIEERGGTLREELAPADFNAVVVILKKVFLPVHDSRIAYLCTYSTWEILVVTTLAMLCGANTWVAIAGFAYSNKNRLVAERLFVASIPCADTFKRVFRKVITCELSDAVTSYMYKSIREVYGFVCGEEITIVLRQYCLDGQSLNHSGRSDKAKTPKRNNQHLHIYDTCIGATVAIAKVDVKTNEIPVAQKILKKENLKYTVVTADALHTQKQTCAIITDPNFRDDGPNKYCTGDYVFGVKGNQDSLDDALGLCFSTSKINEMNASEECLVDYDEKTKITRRYYLVPASCGKNEWSGLKGFACCITENKGEVTDTRYFITSLDDIKDVAEAIRTHWHVENKVHYVLDTAYEQDANTTMDENACINRGIMFTFVDFLLNFRNTIYGYSDSRKVARVSCSLDPENHALGECFPIIPKRRAAVA